ncbi:MAG: GNAT family N-acetyltransferase [Bacteroidia bacterium]|nr:GNAT family N-acetyltransferase [Bacteroidia bacterium]
MEVTVVKVLSGKQLDTIFAIRQKVFVDEQKVDPALEYDEFEETSVHFLAIADGEAVGTARWRRTPNGFKLERFAVLEPYRNKGIGGAIVEAVLKDLPDHNNVYLHSQIDACGLYSRFGFVPEGDQFVEANIVHYKMVLRNR